VKELTAVQRFAVIVAVVIIAAFAVFVVASLATSQGLPIWAIVAIVAFVISLILYPLMRRRSAPPHDSAADRKDPK
jgi:4-hydroxybenzoate polyprenyltransferase